MTSAMLLEETERITSMSFPNYVAEYVTASAEFLDGIRRGLADLRRGDITPWEDVKQELGLGTSLSR